jgi:hypothetical protein
MRKKWNFLDDSQYNWTANPDWWRVFCVVKHIIDVNMRPVWLIIVSIGLKIVYYHIFAAQRGQNKKPRKELNYLRQSCDPKITNWKVVKKIGPSYKFMIKNDTQNLAHISCTQLVIISLWFKLKMTHSISYTKVDTKVTQILITFLTLRMITFFHSVSSLFDISSHQLLTSQLMTTFDISAVKS